MVEAKQCSPPRPSKNPKVLMKNWQNGHKASKGLKDKENVEPPIQKVQKTGDQNEAHVLADRTNSSMINTYQNQPSSQTLQVIQKPESKISRPEQPSYFTKHQSKYGKGPLKKAGPEEAKAAGRLASSELAKKRSQKQARKDKENKPPKL